MPDTVYSDTADNVLVRTTSALMDLWTQFEHDVFAGLIDDPAQRWEVLLNVGAGARVAQLEEPFVSRFRSVYLLEPDPQRRQALTQATAGRDMTILSDRIEDLGADTVPPADFVLCKYVLQHIRTDLLPAAVAGLKRTVAPQGTIGVFSAASKGEPYFRLSVPAAESGPVPQEYRERSKIANDMFVATITEDQFNRLLSRPQAFPFITTHHIGQRALAELFSEFATEITVSPFGAVFLQARRD